MKPEDIIQKIESALNLPSKELAVASIMRYAEEIAANYRESCTFTIGETLQTIEQMYGVTSEQMKTKAPNKKQTPEYQDLAMYALVRRHRLKFKEVGRIFNVVDSTVHLATKRVEQKCKKEPVFRAKLQILGI